jgi:hypothetical protein
MFVPARVGAATASRRSLDRATIASAISRAVLPVLPFSPSARTNSRMWALAVVARRRVRKQGVGMKCSRNSCRRPEAYWKDFSSDALARWNGRHALLQPLPSQIAEKITGVHVAPAETRSGHNRPDARAFESVE